MVKRKKKSLICNWMSISFLLSILIIILFSFPKFLIAACSTNTPVYTNTSVFIWGTATIEGVGYVQHGDEIRAYVKDVEVNEGCVGLFVVNTNLPGYETGAYGSISVYGDDAGTVNLKDGAVTNDLIYFTICHNGIEYKCRETANWTFDRDIIRLDLSGIPDSTADFTADPNSGCTPLTINFINNSTYATSYFWNFGDGATSTEENPAHVYADANIYKVTLSVTNVWGESAAEKIASVDVKKEPIANFTANPIIGPMPLSVQFTDASEKGPTYWHWDFGDGTMSEEKDPNHVYEEPGLYTVRLAVSNGFCSSEKTRNIQVIPTISLTGTILKQGASEGIDEAEVFVVGYPKYRSITNDFGEYTLSHLPVGDYIFQISAHGYETGFINIIIRTDTDKIPDIYLNPHVGWISGRVLELNDPNKPIQAKVCGFALGSNFYSQKTQTDPNDGSFAIYLSKKGNYRIVASATGYFPDSDPNQYAIDPSDPNTFIEGLALGLKPKPKGPHVQVCSFEWDDPNTGYNSTNVMISVESAVPLADPNVRILRIDGSPIGTFSPIQKDPNTVLISGKTLPHYKTVCSGYAGEDIRKVRIKVSAMDQDGTTTVPYVFRVDPNIIVGTQELSTLGATGENITPAEGGTTGEVGLTDTNGDGEYDDYDNSFVDIPPFSIASDEGDPNFALNEFSIQIERLATEDKNAITATYNVNLIDSNGDPVPNFLVNEDIPITIHLHFNPDTLEENPANLVIKYKDLNDNWKTDGISNMHIEENTIIFNVTHLAPFAGFNENAPINLVADVISLTQIDLTWADRSPDEWGFEIWRCVNCEGDPNILSNYASVDPNITTYSDPNCRAGNIYYYMVRAFNQLGNTDFSNMADVAINECDFPPNAPSDLQAKAVSNSQINLSWTNNSNCINTFKVFRSSAEDPDNFSKITTTASTTYTDDQALKALKTYRYKVKASNLKGDSEFSNIVEATTLAFLTEGGNGICFISATGKKTSSFWRSFFNWISSVW